MKNKDAITRNPAFKLRLNGCAVRVIREALGIKHADLAARSQINPGYLTRLEQGARQPSSEKLICIANALGVPREAISYPDFTA